MSAPLATLLMLLSFLPIAAFKPPAIRRPKSQWPRTFSRHIARGISVAIAESVKERGVKGGTATAAKLAGMVFQELFYFPLTMVPFAVRTVRYRSANMETLAASPPGLEVYSAAAGTNSEGPLVLYLHGGSWGQGEPWQYALLARRFLDAGASRVAVAKYRLFPSGDVDDMVDDVAAALAWCEAQQQCEQETAAAASVGGPAPPRGRVVLAAQSAGAHLCSLHLTRQAMMTTSDSTWQPDKFVALSGVFDIGPHFAHERTRLVHWLSPMWLAMIGRTMDKSDAGLAEAFRAIDLDGSGKLSPSELRSYIFEAYSSIGPDGATLTVGPGVVERMMQAADTNKDGELDLDEFKAVMRAGPAKRPSAGGVEGGRRDGGGFVEQVAILSDEPSEAQGIDAEALRAAGLCKDEIAKSAAATQSDADAAEAMWSVFELRAWAAASPTRLLRLQKLRNERDGATSPAVAVQAASRAWPETVVLHAIDDKTVPVRSAREFVEALGGAPIAPHELRFKEYEKAGHGEIMLSLMSRQPTSELPAVCRDFVESVCRE